MNEPKKISLSQAANETEATYMLPFLLLDHFTTLIKAGGIFSLILLPILDWIKIYDTWKNTTQMPFQKKWFERGFGVLKAVATTVGVTFALVGMIAVGFAVIIAGAYAAAVKSLGHAFSSLKKAFTLKDSKYLGQALSHTKDFVLTAVLATGFVLMTFIPGLQVIGFGLALGAAIGIFLSHVYQRAKTKFSEKASYKAVKTESADSPSATRDRRRQPQPKRGLVVHLRDARRAQDKPTEGRLAQPVVGKSSKEPKKALKK